MAIYQFQGVTSQYGAPMPNLVAAIKVDPLGTPVFTILDQVYADDITGDFMLEWGSTSANANEDWAGRVMIMCFDTPSAPNLDCKVKDWQVGTEVV